MRTGKSRWIGIALVLLVTLGACRNTAPTSTPVPALFPQTSAATSAVPNNPTPTQVPPTPTLAPPAPPTATPLPTWPDRWQQTGGPQGGSIAAIALSPTDADTLYAAGLGGVVYTSRDGGETWVPGERLVPPHCTFTSLVVDAEDGNTIYAANPCAGIVKSSDGGANWAGLRDAISDGIGLLAQSAHAPGTLLAASADGQVYRSADGALTWESISEGLPGARIASLTLSGPEIYWATTADGIDGSLFHFRSGLWSPVALGHPPQSRATNVLVDPEDPALIYVGLEYLEATVPLSGTVGLMRSSDGGLTWSPLRPFEPPGDTDDLQAKPNAQIILLGKGQQSGVLYASDGQSLLTSVDGGDNWQRIKLTGDAIDAREPRQMAINPTDNQLLYLSLATGVAKSEDGGHSWKAINHGLNNVAIGMVTSHPTDPATLYSAPTAGLVTFISTDYGDTWTGLANHSIDHPAAQRSVALILDPNQPNTLYQLVDIARAYRSDDAGGSWSLTWPDFRFSSIYSLAIAPADPNIIYANKSGFGLFRSNDAGQTWRLLREADVDHAPALAIHPNNADFVLSGENGKRAVTGARLRRSRDGGNTWDTALEIPNAIGFTSAAIDPRVEPYFRPGTQPADPTPLYAASIGPRGMLWFSNDAGDSWKPLNDHLSFANIHTLTAVPHRPGVVYAGVWGGGTWRTEDGGQTWHRLPGDPATWAVGIVVDPNNHNTIYIADGTTPHLYRSTDDGGSWELLFDAGTDYARLATLAIAPSDPRILYASALNAANGADNGTVFRIDTSVPTEESANDITSNLPGVVSSLAIDRFDPYRVLATVEGNGLWKTVDGGASWRAVKSGLPDASFFQVAIDPKQPNTVYLAGGHDVRPGTSERTGLDPDEMYGIWKSTDDGNTWTKVGGATFGRSSGPIKAIAFHPEDERVKYAVGEKGVFLSPDQGETWTSINGRLPFIPMNAVATNGESLYVGSAGGGIFPGTIHPLIYTADWVPDSQLAVPVDNIQITLHPGDPQILYASAYPGGVFKTTDGGTTWNAHNFGLPSVAVADPARQGHYSLAIAPSAPETLYLGLFEQGVYRSDDGAATWRPVYGNQGELQHASVQSLLVHPDDADMAYATTEDGVWSTTDGGQSWEAFSEGLPHNGAVRILTLGHNGQLYAGSLGYGVYTRNVYQADDNGWQQLPELGNWGLPWASGDGSELRQATTLLVQPGDSDTLYAAAYPYGVFKTLNGGLTWREQSVGLGNRGAFILVGHPSDNHTLYAGTTDSIVRSLDGGATWHHWGAGWPSHQWGLSIAIDPTDPEIMYACSRDGATGQEAEGAIPPLDDTGGGIVMKSTDGGATWFAITTGLDLNQAFYQILIDRFDSNIIYLVAEQDGVFISRDGGNTWSSWNEGLWNTVTVSAGVDVPRVLQFSANGRLLYLGTSGSGVWRRAAEGAP